MTATDATPAPLPRDPAFKCAPWTRAQDPDPIGSTPQFDAVILVEWPLPWPNDISDIPALAPAAATPGVRVMLVLPHSDTSAGGYTRVVHRWRAGLNHLPGVDHVVLSADAPTLVATLAEQARTDSSHLPSAVHESPPEVLVCGHGRRDPCCGRWGTLLHVELAAQLGDARVWRCSHTGGHRYAPTAITLPEGRAWAYAEPDLLAAVVRRRGDAADIGHHDRGSAALGPWAQVLERSVLAELGWAWLDQRQVGADVQVAEDGQSASVALAWETGSAVGEVVVVRQLPVLVCGEPPDSAKKTSPEYELRGFEISASGA